MRSNISRTPSAGSLPEATLTSALSPARGFVLDPELVEAARHDEVDQVVDRVGTVVEAGGKEEDRGTGFLYFEHVPQVDARERRLARAQDELAAFLQRDARRPVDEVGHRARGDRPERPHRARTDHIRVDLRRAARVRRPPVALRVDDRAVDAVE